MLNFAEQTGSGAVMLVWSFPTMIDFNFPINGNNQEVGIKIDWMSYVIQYIVQLYDRRYYYEYYLFVVKRKWKDEGNKPQYDHHQHRDDHGTTSSSVQHAVADKR